MVCWKRVLLFYDTTNTVSCQHNVVCTIVTEEKMKKYLLVVEEENVSWSKCYDVALVLQVLNIPT